MSGAGKDGWIFDMATAPKGSVVKTRRMIGRNEAEVEHYQSVTIFAAGADGETVTPTRWLPKEERWAMFSKDAPPIAWRPWPVHPLAVRGATS